MRKPSEFLESVICIGSSLISLVAPDKYPIENENDLRLNAVLTADLHTDGNPFRDRNNVLRKALSGIARRTSKPDVLVLAGDITNSAHVTEYRYLTRMLKAYDRKIRVLAEMGNHDSRGTSIEPDFPDACKLFRGFCEKQGIKTDENYYYSVINGYYFIVMGTQKLMMNEAFISPAQQAWLDSVLTLAEKSGKPAFVISHQPLKCCMGAQSDWEGGSLGEESAAVYDIIKKHTANGMSVLYISGHLHCDISENCFVSENGFYSLNLPSLLYSDGGGQGFTMEAYDDKILLTARNFIDKKRIEDLRRTIKL